MGGLSKYKLFMNNATEQKLIDWKSSLCKRVERDALFARSPIAHKWKAPFRSMILRECIAWRAQDILAQSLQLYNLNHLLGARILLRSAFETIAILIYLNQLTRKVLAGSLDFHQFSDKTAELLLGSRDESTNHVAINIITVLQKCNARYSGIESLYAMLSESAHPNYEGTCIGYSDADQKNHITTFSNKWSDMYGKNHLSSIELCITVFNSEYSYEWTDSFEKLELWIVENDSKLEATKSG